MQQQVGGDNLPQCTHNCYSVDAMDKEARVSTRGDVGNADDNLSQCATYICTEYRNMKVTLAKTCQCTMYVIHEETGASTRGGI